MPTTKICLQKNVTLCLLSEVESSRTSLASRTYSRTHFEVLGLGFEASSPRKLPSPRLEDSTIFWTVEILLESARYLAEICEDLFLSCLSWDRLKKVFWRPFSPEEFFLRPVFLKSPEKSFWRPFFGHLRLWPWSLASRGSVLGFEIFLCFWPWLRALSTSAYYFCNLNTFYIFF